MDDTLIACFILGVAAVAGAACALAGYAIRAAISNNRHTIAQRRLIDSWQSSGPVEPTEGEAPDAYRVLHDGPLLSD